MYQRVGVATAFSPRFLAVLAEAGRVAHSLGAPLELIHADAFDEEKVEKFRKALADLELDTASPIRFETGEPASAILRSQEANGIDLLAAGALEQEAVHRSFTGNVARELMRLARCDVLLFIEPRETPENFKRVIVAVPDVSATSQNTFRKAAEFAMLDQVTQLDLVLVETTFAEAKVKAMGGNSGSSEPALEEMARQARTPGITIDYEILRGNTGFTACEAIQASGADLLVVPSAYDASGAPVFAPALDWVLQVIPANLLVIRN
jgi:nucleotide-binding universal stress UspA family protein